MSNINLNPGQNPFLTGLGQTKQTGHTGQTAEANKVAGAGNLQEPAVVGNPFKTSQQIELQTHNQPDINPATKDRLENAMKALEGALSGNLDQLIGAIMIKMANEQRQNAMNDRTAGYAAAKASLEGQAAKLNEAADKQLAGAITALVTSVVSGAITIGASLKSLKEQAGAVKDMTKSLDGMKYAQSNLNKLGDVGGDTGKAAQQAGLKGDMAKFEHAFKLAEAKSGLAATQAGLARTVGEMMQSSGNASSQVTESQAKRDEANAQLEAAEATNHQQNADMAKEIQQSMKDMMAAIINFIKEMQDIQVEQMRAVTRG